MSNASADRLQECLDRFDAANAEDPRHEADGAPKELVYSRRMSAWLERLAPSASEEVRLAVRAQHIRRWEIPRDAYPKGRTAYLKWRRALGVHHADLAGAIMRDCGYSADTVLRVQGIIRKERLKTDPWAQELEDVACLVFLDHYFDRFVDEQDSDTIIKILRRTWRKMSAAGQQAALKINYTPRCLKLLEAALHQSTSYSVHTRSESSGDSSGLAPAERHREES